MEAPQGLPEFLAYLHDHTAEEPEIAFPARAARSRQLPRMFSTLPAGDVYLYRDFFVFLTLVEGPAGAGLLWKQVAQSVGRDLKQIHMAYKAATNPSSLLLDAAKWLVKQFRDEDVFAKAVSNPNSLFVPLDDVVHVAADRKWSQGNYIQVATRDDSVFVCQNIADQSDTIVELWQVGRSMFTKQWQTPFVDRVNERIGQNGNAKAA